MRKFSNHSIIILCNSESIIPEQGGDSDRGQRGKERRMEVRERWREWERGLHVQVLAEVLMVSSQASASSKEASTKAHGPSSQKQLCGPSHLHEHPQTTWSELPRYQCQGYKVRTTQSTPEGRDWPTVGRKGRHGQCQRLLASPLELALNKSFTGSSKSVPFPLFTPHYCEPQRIHRSIKMRTGPEPKSKVENPNHVLMPQEY